MKNKFLLFAVILNFFIISCSSDDSNTSCDNTWRVKEWCEPKISGITGCQNPITLEKKFCEDDLAGVVPGKIVMYQEDENVRRYREFIEKIK